MSDHQPAEPESGNEATAPAEGYRNVLRGSSADLLELDFSRLEMARASLDAVFSER